MMLMTSHSSLSRAV